MHQCKTSDKKKTFIEGLKTVKLKYGLTQEKIIRYVQSGKLFGVLLCNIETPEELKPTFEEFCPIFKITMVSRHDIGEHMREYAERNNVFKKPRRMLIGSGKGDFADFTSGQMTLRPRPESDNLLWTREKNKKVSKGISVK